MQRARRAYLLFCMVLSEREEAPAVSGGGFGSWWQHAAAPPPAHEPQKHTQKPRESAHPRVTSKTSMKLSCEPAASLVPSGEYDRLSTASAKVRCCATTLAISSDSSTLTVPSVVPTARCAPLGEKATECAGSPTATLAISMRRLALNRWMLCPSQAVTKR